MSQIKSRVSVNQIVTELNKEMVVQLSHISKNDDSSMNYDAGCW